MELDDLKKTWKESGDKIKLPHQDVWQLIQSRGEQPLTKLKRRFRRGMLLMPLLAAIIIMKLSHKKDFASHFLVWYFLCFCIIMLVYFVINFQLVNKMESGEGDVRSNLIMQTKTLSKLLRLRLILMRGGMALFFVLLEALMYLRHGAGYESWQAYNVFLRLAIYIAVFIFFFFFTRMAMNHRYKKHIENLQGLVKELEEE